MTLPDGIHVAWREVHVGVPRRDVSRALLAEALPGVRFDSRCASCGGDHGPVHAEGTDAAVSVSYAPGWAVVAVARHHARVGVDAVPSDVGGLERVLPPGADAARAWARIEAVLKADGRGLAVDPARIDVVSIDGRAWEARLDERSWRGWDLPGPDGVVVAVAASSPR